MTSRPPRRRNVAGKLFLNLAAIGVIACGRASSPTPSTPGGEQRPDSLEQVAPAAAPAPAPEAAPAPPAPAAASEANEPVEANDRERSATAAMSAPREDDLQSAQAELERARVELNQALAARAPGAHAPKPSSGGAAASRGAADEAPAKAEKKSEGSSCSMACRAFSSLDRAAAAVCRITGEKDGRCSHAHAVVADAKKRVAVCPCSSE